MGVIVGHLPDFCTREVANQALALLLVCARKTLQLDHALRTAGWKAAKAMQSPMGSVHGETLGIIGLGRIGQALARRALALDMKIIACDPYVGSSVFATAGVQAVGLNDLARRADYVSCHVPLTGETRDMINARFFALMKPTAYFINTSRGAVVNELDLIAALQEKRIAGAGLDVFAEEPIAPTHPLCLLDNVVLSPHNASYADQTKIVQQRRVGTDVLAFCRGGLPQFVANPDVLSHRRA
jgi:D-3-phosphoglycerate dehydrogenase